MIRRIPFGTTAEGRDIPAYAVGYDNSGPDASWVKMAQNRPSMLITGGHHAREVSSTSMCVYTVLDLLYMHVQRTSQNTHLLSSTMLFVVPSVNWDGYNYISD